MRTHHRRGVVVVSLSSSLFPRLHCVVASPSFPCRSHAMPWVWSHTHRRQRRPRRPLVVVAKVAALTRCRRHLRHARRTALASTSQQEGGVIDVARVATRRLEGGGGNGAARPSSSLRASQRNSVNVVTRGACHWRCAFATCRSADWRVVRVVVAGARRRRRRMSQRADWRVAVARARRGRGAVIVARIATQ